MNLSRRKFFGAGAATIVAGPSALKETAAGSGPLIGGLLRRAGNKYAGETSYLGETAQTPRVQAEYLASHRKHLERLIAGEFEEWETEHLSDDIPSELAALANVEALKSISRAGQISIGRAALIRHRKDKRIQSAKRELASMAKSWLGLK